MITSVSSSQEIGVLAGVLLSLLMKYVPAFSDWYGRLRVTIRQVFMLALLVGAVAILFVGGCLGLTGVACSQEELKGLFLMLVAAVVSNQATHAITPETARVAAIKETRNAEVAGAAILGEEEETVLSGDEKTALIVAAVIVVLSIAAVVLALVFLA